MVAAPLSVTDSDRVELARIASSAVLAHRGHNAGTAHCADAPEPPRVCPRRRRVPRTPRTRSLQSRCAGRQPAARAIPSHCARRCPLLRFLTLDKPETLGDNDVRPLSAEQDPRKGHKSPIYSVRAEGPGAGSARSVLKASRGRCRCRYSGRTRGFVL